MGSEYCDDHVCLSVCVCLSANISLEIHVLSLPKILCMLLPMSVAQSFSGGIAIHYVLSVLWMASYLHVNQGSSTWPPSWSKHSPMQPWTWLGMARRNSHGKPVDSHTHGHAFRALRSGHTRLQWACWIFMTLTGVLFGHRSLSLLSCSGRVCGLWLPYLALTFVYLMTDY